MNSAKELMALLKKKKQHKKAKKEEIETKDFSKIVAGGMFVYRKSQCYKLGRVTFRKVGHGDLCFIQPSQQVIPLGVAFPSRKNI